MMTLFANLNLLHVSSSARTQQPTNQDRRLLNLSFAPAADELELLLNHMSFETGPRGDEMAASDRFHSEMPPGPTLGGHRCGGGEKRSK